MNSYSKSVVVLPCHTLEDFPTHYQDAEAKNLLACWTAIWHPVLLTQTGHRPEWISFHDPRLDAENCLVILPSTVEDSLEESFETEANEKSCHLIRGKLNRDGVLNQIAGLDSQLDSLMKEADKESVNDFFALAYGFLQVQIMTRQLRYSSNLDEDAFFEKLLNAAHSILNSQRDEATELLTNCFDMLLEEKNSYYPVQPELMDLVVTAESTLGDSLAKQLDVEHRQNLMITGEHASVLSRKSPSTLEKLKSRISESRLTVVGGIQSELPDPLMSNESIVRQLAEGRRTLGNVLGVQPTVFGRRRAGLSTKLPGLLEQFDFVGVIHATLDEGKFPKGSSSNIRWTGDDQNSLLAYGDFPLSADDSGALLSLGVKIGEQIDSAHVSTMIFAHWPDRTCDAYQDLLRVSRYCPLLGEFVCIDEYFDSVYDPGYGDTFTADEYKTPYLQQSVAAKDPYPISAYVNYWSNSYKLSGCRSLLTQLAIHVSTDSALESQTVSIEECLGDLRAIELENDLSADSKANAPDELNSKVDEIVERTTQLAMRIFQADAERKNNFLLLNPASAKKRVAVQIPVAEKVASQSNGPVLFADSGTATSDLVVEVPPVGAVRFECPQRQNKDPFRSVPSVVEGNVLRNEYFEVLIDDQSGGIRSISLYGKKNNLVSQRLALRIPGAIDGNRGNGRRQPARYTEMFVDEILPIENSRIRGSILVNGRLRDQETDVAEFEQKLSICRGIPRVDLDIEIRPTIKLSSSINHYFCSRLAWKDETADLHCNALQARHQVLSDWFEATNFVEIKQGDALLTMMTGGIPFHRRVSRRMLDTPLIIGNEQARRFRVAFEVNQPYPLSETTLWMTPHPLIPLPPDSLPQDGWMFHFNCRNILATWWSPIWENGDPQATLIGVSMRLQETEGRSGSLKIRCPQPIGNAARTNLLGEFVRAIDLENEETDIVPVEFNQNEYFQISIYWQK